MFQKNYFCFKPNNYLVRILSARWRSTRNNPANISTNVGGACLISRSDVRTIQESGEKMIHSCSTAPIDSTQPKIAHKQIFSKPVSASVVATSTKTYCSCYNSYGMNLADTKRRKGNDGSRIASHCSVDKRLKGVKRQTSMDDNNIRSVPSQLPDRTKTSASNWNTYLSDSSSDDEDECVSSVKSRLDNKSSSKIIATTKHSMFAIEGDYDFGPEMAAFPEQVTSSATVCNQTATAKSPFSSPNVSVESDFNRAPNLSAAKEVESDDSTDDSSDSSSSDDYEDIDELYSNSIISSFPTLGLKDCEKRNTTDNDDESNVIDYSSDADDQFLSEEINDAIYFERQEEFLCGMHAINNLLQDQFFGKEEMFDIGLILLEEIGDYEAIEDVETFNENGTPFKNYLFNSKGDFSQDILVRCLNLAVNAETIDCLVDTPNFIELVRLE